jgi:hypothetical protein
MLRVLEELVGMGFTDNEKNYRLYEANNGNLEKCLNQLL